MKKIIFVLALTAGVLTSCDPLKDEGTFEVNNTTSEALLQGATFSQYNAIKNDDGTITYEPCADGNYIKYSIPSVPSVDIYYIKKDGSESLLSYGSNSGIFNFVPPRGSESDQEVYFRFVNADLKEVVASKSFTLQVAGELSFEMKLLCSNSGSKTWKWLVDGDTPCWGNAGYSGFVDGGASSMTGGQWWGVTVEGLAEQIANYGYNFEDGEGATMTFMEDGSLTKSSGGKGSFKIEDDKTNIGGYDGLGTTQGRLITSGDGILFPVRINVGVTTNEFDIVYLTASDLVLAYPNYMADNPENQSWMECTFWRFKSGEDIQGMLSDYTEATWTWYEGEDGAALCWGNAGYSSFIEGGASSLLGGQWWGVDTAGLSEQIENYGYGFNDGAGATMTFLEDGTLTKSSGGKGAYSFDTENNDLGGYGDLAPVQGHLYTTGDGILFPVRINAGETTNAFDIIYLSGTDCVLAYPNYMADDPENQSWMECTFWRFKKVAE